MRIQNLGATAVLFALLAGCVAAKNALHVEDLEDQVGAPQERYTILPGDELDIRFFHTPDKNLTLPVRPDGYISLPHVLEVSAAGKTPEQLSQELNAAYGDVLIDPQIAVIVRAFSAQRVHVGGRVEHPGVFPLTRSMTVLESIHQAGGYQQQAMLSQVLVIRKMPGGDHQIISVNLNKALNGTDLRQNIELRPYDAVYLPDQPIAVVNTWVDLYIRQNIPFNFGFRWDVGF
jgi:protein involved in polysaccharide export with SLBB domain